MTDIQCLPYQLYVIEFKLSVLCLGVEGSCQSKATGQCMSRSQNYAPV